MTSDSHKCGWCLTGHHDSCRVSVSWYDKTWYCGCSCSKDGKGKPVVPQESKAPAKAPRKKSKRVAHAAQAVLDDVLSNPDVREELDKWDDTPK